MRPSGAHSTSVGWTRSRAIVCSSKPRGRTVPEDEVGRAARTRSHASSGRSVSPLLSRQSRDRLPTLPASLPRVGASRPTKLVMTVVARDEEDVIEANLDYHLAQGVDFVIATDNRSEDRTPEILSRYERQGLLHLIHEPADDYSHGRWVTRMARLAATDCGADWVINCDADEFWWPKTGTLKEVFSAIPERFGMVVAPSTAFV